MARAGKHQIGLRLDDVIHIKFEMTIAEDRCWRLRYEIGVDGTHEMARASALDHLGNVSQGTDVNARRLADYHDRSLLIDFFDRDRVPANHGHFKNGRLGHPVPLGAAEPMEGRSRSRARQRRSSSS